MLPRRILNAVVSTAKVGPFVIFMILSSLARIRIKQVVKCNKCGSFFSVTCNITLPWIEDSYRCPMLDLAPRLVPLLLLDPKFPRFLKSASLALKPTSTLRKLERYSFFLWNINIAWMLNLLLIYFKKKTRAFPFCAMSCTCKKNHFSFSFMGRTLFYITTDTFRPLKFGFWCFFEDMI